MVHNFFVQSKVRSFVKDRSFALPSEPIQDPLRGIIRTPLEHLDAILNRFAGFPPPSIRISIVTDLTNMSFIDIYAIYCHMCQCLFASFLLWML